MEFEKIPGDVQDTLTVMAEIQRRQAAVQKNQAEWLEELQEGHRLLLEHQLLMKDSQKLHDARMAQFDLKMVELTEKLDALVRWAGGSYRRPQ